ANIVASFIASYGLSPADRVLQQTTITFDVAVNEIFPILAVGGSLVLVPSEAELDFERLAALVVEEGVTILGAAPSVLARWNEVAGISSGISSGTPSGWQGQTTRTVERTPNRSFKMPEESDVSKFALVCPGEAPLVCPGKEQGQGVSIPTDGGIPCHDHRVDEPPQALPLPPLGRDEPSQALPLPPLGKGARSLGRLRLILSGGEALSWNDVDQLLDRATVINGYGPTEATVCALS
ncbi:MAG: amino acid adenylation domain-containing protein, partial [bacterium]|nr:amino acid adenylation domain-containing protein [bacterium]